MNVILNSVYKHYKDAGSKLTVINDLSTNFNSGEHVAIIGRSGIGKSTLLHILGGLDSPSTGSILVGSQDLAKMDADQRSDFRASQVGFVFQFHHLLADFSALENVAMPLYIQGLSEGVANAKASDLLTRAGLKERLKHRPGELSGGEQQRVAVARALVNNPSLVLADEPTGSLDEHTGLLVQNLLRSVCTELGATLIVVTHNSELASSFDRILEMHSGGKLSAVAN